MRHRLPSHFNWSLTILVGRLKKFGGQTPFLVFKYYFLVGLMFRPLIWWCVLKHGGSSGVKEIEHLVFIYSWKIANLFGVGHVGIILNRD